MKTGRREFIGAALGAGILGAQLALAQAPAPTGRQAGAGRGGGRGARPARKVKTTTLFRSPEGFPNALAKAPEGLWIGEQKAATATDRSEKAMLVDWNGKLLKTLVTDSRNTSGMAYGDGYIWMVANAAPQGVFQVDMNSKLVSHRQIPLGPANGDGGGSHGAKYHDGKLWIVANRLRGILRVDPKTWTPEYMIPIPTTFARWHDIAFDADGAIWMVTGTSNTIGPGQNRAGLVKFDANTGQVLETAEFGETDADPHGLEIHDGVFYSCDAGIGPGMVDTKSPTSRFIFRIDFI